MNGYSIGDIVLGSIPADELLDGTSVGRVSFIGQVKKIIAGPDGTLLYWVKPNKHHESRFGRKPYLLSVSCLSASGT